MASQTRCRVLWIAGVLVAASLVWVIRPLRASVARLSLPASPLGQASCTSPATQ